MAKVMFSVCLFTGGGPWSSAKSGVRPGCEVQRGRAWSGGRSGWDVQWGSPGPKSQVGRGRGLTYGDTLPLFRRDRFSSGASYIFTMVSVRCLSVCL